MKNLTKVVNGKKLVVVSKDAQKLLSVPTKKLSPKEVVKSTVAKVAKNSDYKKDVLNVNAEFKLALRSTGKALKILLSSDVLNSKQIAFIKDLQKNEAKYNKFDSTIRRTKANLITPFYVLQAMHKAIN